MSRFGPGEVPKQGIRVSHLRNLLGMDERSQLDEVNTGGEQSFDPTDLLFQRDRQLLNLQSIARPNFVNKDFLHVAYLTLVKSPLLHSISCVL